MSAVFIVRYAGAPIRFGRFTATVTPELATPFTSEADAWYAAYKANLSPNHLRVVPAGEIEQPRREGAKGAV